MEPRNIGRALGIGVRVAGRIAGRRVAGSASPSTNKPVANVQSLAGAPTFVAPARPQPQPAARVATEPGRTVRKGIGGLLRPFRRVGGIVWLEATGTFFLLFAALFALRLWQSWSGIGAVSRSFAIGAAVVFLYLGITAFWRARQR